MNINKLESLLHRGESSKIDFKAEMHLKTEQDKKEFARDIIALANTKGGRGYLIFGVEDKTKKILGVDPRLFHEEKMTQIVNTRSYPPIPIRVEKLSYHGKMLVVIVVYRSELKPHQMIQNGAFYIRRGSTTDVARREELASMFQENGLFSYERTLFHRLPLDVLDMQAVQEMFGENKLILEALGIIGQYSEMWHPTYGGLLLFGKKPQDFLPHTFIKIVNDHEITTISGSISSMLTQVETYVRFRCGDATYPIEGLMEAVANALIHRDYMDVSAGITIEIDHRHVTVTNPGSLLPGNKLYDQKHISENPRRRNPWLYQRALLIDEDQRIYKYGLGIEKINHAFESYGEVKYVNLDSKNLFKVVLPIWH